MPREGTGPGFVVSTNRPGSRLQRASSAGARNAACGYLGFILSSKERGGIGFGADRIMTQLSTRICLSVPKQRHPSGGGPGTVGRRRDPPGDRRQGRISLRFSHARTGPAPGGRWWARPMDYPADEPHSQFIQRFYAAHSFDPERSSDDAPRGKAMRWDWNRAAAGRSPARDGGDFPSRPGLSSAGASRRVPARGSHARGDDHRGPRKSPADPNSLEARGEEHLDRCPMINGE